MRPPTCQRIASEHLIVDSFASPTLLPPDAKNWAHVRMALQVFEDDKRAREWQRIYREILEGNDSPNFTDAFRGFPASVDDPGALLWREVLKQYPDVKVSRDESAKSTRVARMGDD